MSESKPPVTPPSSSAGPGDPSQAFKDLLQPTVEERLGKLQPPTGHTSRPAQLILSVVLLIALIGVVAWSILTQVGVIPPLLGQNSSKGSEGIRLVTSEEQLIAIVVRHGDEGEVKLINTVTGQIQDISGGDKQASHAALSSRGDIVAYASTSDQGSALYLVSITGTHASVFNSTGLNSAAKPMGSPTVRVCDWSELYWSPNDDKIAFWACGVQSSALFIVSVESGVDPQLVSDTSAASIKPRSAAWLRDGNLTITSGGGDSDELLLIDMTQAIPQPRRLYGPRK